MAQQLSLPGIETLAQRRRKAKRRLEQLFNGYALHVRDWQPKDEDDWSNVTRDIAETLKELTR